MKKNRLLAIILCFALLCECSAKTPKQTKTLSDNDVPAQAIHALGLTAEQRMEDYEGFWATLRDSYPCWGILEREGLDVDAIYQNYRELVAGSDSDVDFYSAIYSSLYRLGMNGHLWIVEPDAYASYVDNVTAYKDSDRAHWAEILQDAKTASGYAKLGAMLDILGWDEEEGGNVDEDNSANVTSQMLPGNIGYLKSTAFPVTWRQTVQKSRIAIHSVPVAATSSLILRTIAAAASTIGNSFLLPQISMRR